VPGTASGVKMVGMAEMEAPIILDGVSVHPDCWCICLCYLHLGALKMQDRKMQDWNLVDQIAGPENAGLEFGGSNSRAGKCRTGI